MWIAFLALAPIVVFIGFVFIQARRNQELFINQAAETLRTITGERVVARMEDFYFQKKAQFSDLTHWKSPKLNAATWKLATEPTNPELKATSITLTSDRSERPRAVPRVVQYPRMAREGRWQEVKPGLWTTKIRPDFPDYWEEVDLVAIDTRKYRLKYVPGTEITGDPVQSRIADRDLANVCTVFNGGFRPSGTGRKNTSYEDGIRIESREFRPLTLGRGTIAISTNTVRILKWDSATSATFHDGHVRQNLVPLLENGQCNPDFLLKKHQAFETYRSALGQTADHRWLVYAASPEASPEDLAHALRLAKCATAIHLDMNWGCVYFDFTTSDKDAKLLYRPLEPQMHKFHNRQLTAGSTRDFFYLVPQSNLRS